MQRLFAVGLAMLCVFSALPISARAQQPADREAIKASAAAAAVELSRLEVAGKFDELYDRMHPDAQAVIPRAVVVGWYTNDFAPLHAGVSTVFTTLLTPWTWDVTGTTYWDAATVVYQQPFGDGSVAQGQVHLVSVDGQWRWFFGKSREFVNEQIAKYTATPTPVPTSTPRPTMTPLPTWTPAPTATPIPTQPARTDDVSRIAALETQTANLQFVLDEERVRNAALATQVADLQGRVLVLERQSPASASVSTATAPATLPPATPTFTDIPPWSTPMPTVTSTPAPTTTPMPTSTPSPTPPPSTATPTSPPTAPPPACSPLADVRDLATHTRNYLGKKIAFEGIVVSLFDTGQPAVLGDSDPRSYKAQMQVAVEAPDGSYDVVMIGVVGDTMGIYVGSTVRVCGTVVDTDTFIGNQGGAVTQPLVDAENVLGE